MKKVRETRKYKSIVDKITVKKRQNDEMSSDLLVTKEMKSKRVKKDTMELPTLLNLHSLTEIKSENETDSLDFSQSFDQNELGSKCDSESKYEALMNINIEVQKDNCQLRSENCALNIRGVP